MCLFNTAQMADNRDKKTKQEKCNQDHQLTTKYDADPRPAFRSHSPGKLRNEDLRHKLLFLLAAEIRLETILGPPKFFKVHQV